MANAWDKGMSTNDFRKCKISDLSFIYDYKIAQDERFKKKEQEHKVIDAMNKLKAKHYG